MTVWGGIWIAALSDGSVAHFDEALGAAKESVLDIVAKATVSDNQRLSSRQLTIEPGGALTLQSVARGFAPKGS